MASRREFTFGSMILALTGARTARAAEPIAELTEASKTLPERKVDKEPEPPELDIDFAVSRKGKELHVAMQVTNRHSAPVELVAARGSMPGAYLEAAVEIDGQRFDLPVIYEGDRREFFSRAGPVPRFERVASAATLALGTYRFQWPDGVPDLPVQVRGGIDVEMFYVDFERTLPLGTAAAKAS